MRWPICVSLIAVIGITGCVSSGEFGNYPRSKVATARKISCQGDAGAELRGYYTVYSPSEIGLAFGDQNYALRRERTASGAKYKNSSAMFWNKGIDGLLEMKDGGTYSCRFLPDDATFEDVSDDMNPAPPAAVEYAPVSLPTPNAPITQAPAGGMVPIPPQKPTTPAYSVPATSVPDSNIPRPPVKPRPVY